MFDDFSAVPMRGAEAPHAPTWASSILAFAARLGLLLLAGALGTLWIVVLFVGVLPFSPGSSPAGSGRLVAIVSVLTALLIGGIPLAVTARRRRSVLARSILGLLVALLCSAGILALIVPAQAAPIGFLLISGLAGAIALVVTYLVAGLRVVPTPYQRYSNLGYGIASWFLVTVLTLPVPDQGFTTITLLGLPFAALGGLVGGALNRAFLGTPSQRRPAQMPLQQSEHAAPDVHADPVTLQTARESPRPEARGVVWRLTAACLLGVVAVPFGPGEPVTLTYSLLVLGFFAGTAIVLDLSILGWRPGLILLLCFTIAIAWGGGAAILQATGQLLFFSPTGAAAQAPFVAFVGICALLCELAVDGADLHAGREPGERRGMAHLARQIVFWLAVGLSCWLGVAAILLWRGAPGMLMGSETPGQIPLAAALPLVGSSLPVALLGALAGGALRRALLHGERLMRGPSVGAA